MLDVPRLSAPGFRWAPRSLLGSQALAAHLMTASDKPEWATQLMGQGLAVRFAGWDVARATATSSLSPEEFIVCETHLRGCFNASIHARHGNGQWYRMIASPSLLAHTGLTSLESLPQTFTLLQDPTVGVEPEFRALHVHVEGESNGIKVLRSGSIFIMRKEAPNEQALWNAAYTRAEALRRAGSSPASWRYVEALQRREAGKSANISNSGGPPRYIFEDDVNGFEDLARQLSPTAVPVYDFAMRVLALWVGRYFVVEREYDARTQWCIG